MFFRSSFRIRYIQCLQQKDLEAAKSRRRGGQAKAGRVVVGLWVCYAFGLLRARKRLYSTLVFHVRHADTLNTCGRLLRRHVKPLVWKLLRLRKFCNTNYSVFQSGRLSPECLNLPASWCKSIIHKNSHASVWKLFWAAPWPGGREAAESEAPTQSALLIYI